MREGRIRPSLIHDDLPVKIHNVAAMREGRIRPSLLIGSSHGITFLLPPQ